MAESFQAAPAGPAGDAHAAALRESEERFRIVFERSTLGKAITAPDGRLLQINQAFADLLGYSIAEVQQLNFADVTHPADVALSQELTRQVRDGERESVRFEKRYVQKGGAHVWADVGIALQRNAAGEPLYFITSITDISEQKRGEQRLRESEYFFKATQRAAKVGSFKTDFVNGHWESSEVLDEILGIGPGYDRSTKGWLELVHPEDREAMHRHVREDVIAGGKPFAHEYRVIRPSDGEVRWVLGFGTVDIDAEGKTISLIGTLHDITDRRRAEHERARLQEQLSQSQKMESVGQLAGGVAHDFNNMLGVILGHVELALLQAGPESPLAADLAVVKRAAERSSELTARLLAFARKQPVAPKVLDLNGTVAGMVKMLERLIGEHIALTWRPGDGLWPVKVDPAQIDQLLVNLCINARDAIRDTGEIGIETANAAFDAAFCSTHPTFAAGEYVRLAVRDTGCGMSEETQARIFEPFFTTKAQGEGTGLGLAMVYGIVKQNGGFIDVESAPGRGATLRIYLPRCAGEVPAADAGRPPASAPAPRETVLVVEDEPLILTVTTRMLAHLGYGVLAAKSPGEAFALAKQHAGGVDLLLSDVIMPAMNGRDLAAALLAQHAGLRCLFMSGYTADIIAEHGVLAAGVHFLQKPFTLQELEAKLREALAKPA
jgi:PAS domain S-box-containing protein